MLMPPAARRVAVASTRNPAPGGSSSGITHSHSATPDASVTTSRDAVVVLPTTSPPCPEATAKRTTAPAAGH